SPDAYLAIQRGTADGTVLSWNPYQTFKIGEVTTFHIDAPMGTAAGMLFMSRKVYDGLSPAAKHALDANSGEAASRAWGKWWDGDNANGRRMAVSDPKHKVVTLDPALRANGRRRSTARSPNGARRGRASTRRSPSTSASSPRSGRDTEPRGRACLGPPYFGK